MKNTKINNKVFKPHQDGIALIITIILTSIMLSSVVLVSREMIDEVRNSTRIDNSLIAYYAAEAGLEDALLEWRYNHDAEISQEEDKATDKNSVNVSCTPTNLCTPRMMNLNSDVILENTAKKIYTNSYYELTMWNKTKSIADQVLLRDDVAEFIIPDMTQSVNLGWSNPTPAGSNYRVEVTTYDENGNILPSGKFFTDIGALTSQTIPFISNGKKIIRVRLWGDPPANQIESIMLSLNQSPTPDFISGPITNIESVGYFGGVARKIIAKIDKSSGNIIGINDFAIYSASDLIK